MSSKKRNDDELDFTQISVDRLVEIGLVERFIQDNEYKYRLTQAGFQFYALPKSEQMKRLFVIFRDQSKQYGFDSDE